MANFAKKSGLDWLKMANFGHFAGFPIFSPKMRLRLTQNGQFSISPNSQLFPSLATKASHFWRNLKNFHFWGEVGVHLPNFLDLQLFESFPTKVVQNDPQWPILPLKWLGQISTKT